MIRPLLSALLVAFVTSCVPAPAMAQQCQPVQAEQFIEQAVTSIKSGDTKGIILRNVEAASFGKEIGAGDSHVLAVFLLKIGDDELLMVVFRSAAGTEAVCYGAATPQAKALVEQLHGRGA